MRIDPRSPALRSLLDAPSPATLTLTTEDGRPITSPVWFRLADDAFELVTGEADRKLAHLQRDPECLLLIFEAARPFRGIQVRARASLEPDDGSRTRRAIASRYLGDDDGRVYAALDRRPPGFVIRVPLEGARAWDLSDRLP